MNENNVDRFANKISHLPVTFLEYNTEYSSFYVTLKVNFEEPSIRDSCKNKRENTRINLHLLDKIINKRILSYVTSADVPMFSGKQNSDVYLRIIMPYRSPKSLWP